MKNILLGVLLVALAAVVVNKKMWKQHTFLMLVVGIVVAMLAVAMLYSAKELFQTPSTSSTICTTSGNITIPGTINTFITDFDNFLDGKSDTARGSVNEGNARTTDIKFFLDSSKGPSSANPPNLVIFTNGNPAAVIIRARFANTFANNQCWDRLRKYLIMNMVHDSFIFKYKEQSNYFKTAASTSTSTSYDIDDGSSERRYLNFVGFLVENADLRNMNYNDPTKKDILKITTSTYTNTYLPTNANILAARNHTLLQMLIAYYALRANTTDQDSTTKQMQTFYIGEWLWRASMINSTFSTTSDTRHTQKILRSLLGITLRYTTGSFTGSRAVEMQRYIRDLITSLFHTGPGITATIDNGWINTKYGIVEHKDPNITIRHLHFTLFVCYMIKQFLYDYGDIPSIGIKIINPINQTETTLPNSGTKTIEDLFGWHLKNLVEKTLKVVACHEYIVEANNSLNPPLTAEQLNSRLRNYFADTNQCKTPLDTDDIVTAIKNTNYSTTLSSNNPIPTLIPSSIPPGSDAINEIGLTVRQLLYFSLTKDLGISDNYLNYTNVPRNTPNVEYRGHLNMFKYIFNVPNTTIDTNLRDAYFTSGVHGLNATSYYFFDSYIGNFQGVRLLEIPPETFSNYITTVKNGIKNNTFKTNDDLCMNDAQTNKNSNTLDDYATSINVSNIELCGRICCIDTKCKGYSVSGTGDTKICKFKDEIRNITTETGVNLYTKK